MSLYQNSVLNKYLKALNAEILDDAYIKFKNHFNNPTIQQNIHNAKEEQYQEGFLRDLFVNVLGYTLNPDSEFNLTTELKNIKGSKKTDGAILKGKKALAVIELKGTNTTDLSKVETQAFGYKNNQPGCNYVITSNFEKLRFYIDNAVDFEEFNLFQLTKERFDLLWLCLSADNLLKDIPKQIKDESVTQEENVTKKLYKDYSQFRNEIFDSIQKENPEYDKLTLFKKTQKLLDRFLFIFFAEDRLLVPPNSINKIIEKWKDDVDFGDQKPLYSIFKQYFKVLNVGRPARGIREAIFAYNGGLFEVDKILDNIKINDDLLYKHTLNLSNYDFESEVSVNILGHIFEHSLNDIDEIQAEIQGAAQDKSKTKRKKDGVFYTPKYITKYIVDNTVGKLCEEKKQELDINDDNYQPAKQRSRKRLDNLQTYRVWLLQLTICDPACGSGAFLNQALEFLIAEHAYIDELSAKYNKDALVLSEVENAILENNLFGVDINEESVEIAKLSLWLRTAQKGRKLTSLSNNIKCGNSLIDDPNVAGDKAFNWQKEFPGVFAKGGFDVVIGNPPYVSKSFAEKEKSYYNNNYRTAQYQLDLYVSFMELGVKILARKGKLSYIVPNSWLKNLMFDKCRLFVLNNLHFDIIIPNLENVFADASVDTLIFVGSKGNLFNQAIEVGQFVHKEYFKKHNVNQERFLNNDKVIFDVEISKEIESIFNKIEQQSVPLTKLSDVVRGINPYDKYRGQSAEIIKNKLYHANYKKDKTFVPEIRGKHVNRYSLEWDGESYVSYGDWLAAPREPKYFEGNRIICRQVLGSNLNCTFINSDFVIDQSVFIAKFSEDQSKKINPKFVLAQLTSKLIGYFFRYKANEFDSLFPKIKIGEYKLLPVKKVKEESQILFVDIINKILKLKGTFHKISKKFQEHLQSKYNADRLSNKLQNWHDLEFDEFLKELEKARKKSAKENQTTYNKLSLNEEAEWMQYFNEQKEKAQTLKAEINKTDKEIDQMVYELYGLNEEEIAIVEQS